MRIALFQPDIALNVGAVARTAACLACPLDIILPCGFPFSLKALRRSGMDYLDDVDLTAHTSWEAYLEAQHGRRLILLTTQGSENAAEFSFEDNDSLLFGRESAGAPETVHAAADYRVRLPLAPETRSLNLSISVAMTLTLAYQKCGHFKHLE